jgi:uncharacterized protein DUF3795
MNELISHCGLKCNECDAYIATKDDNDIKRKEVAAKWSKQYKADIRPEDINCEGCLSTGGRVFSHCNVCEIRKCGIERKVVNCAHCSDYICDKINNFFKMVPDVKETLDRIKASIE